MAMQSQAPRSSMAGYGMKRRKGLGLVPKILILLAVLAAGAFFFWGGDGEPPADAAEARNADHDLVDAPATLAGAHPADPSGAGLTAPQPAPPAVLDFGKPDHAPAIKPGPTPTTTTQAEPDPVVQKAVREVERALPKPKPFTSGADAATLYNRGDKLIADGDPIAGRAVLSRLLFAADLQLAHRDAMAVRNRLNEVNAELFWSPEVTEGDSITKYFKNDGSFLGQIGVKFRVPYQLLEIINGISERQLRGDHVLKVVQGATPCPGHQAPIPHGPLRPRPPGPAGLHLLFPRGSGGKRQDPTGQLAGHQRPQGQGAFLARRRNR
ncbi:MAG: hypothetical protein AAF333_09850 [Planctomycetota bacterium]